MLQNSRESEDIGRTFRLYDLLKLGGPAQLITVIDDRNGPDDPIFSGKAVKLLRSEDCELRENLLREVRHFNTTADDMQTLGPGSGVVAECMGAHVDLQAKPARRGLMIYLI